MNGIWPKCASANPSDLSDTSSETRISDIPGNGKQETFSTARRKVKKILLKHPRKGDKQITLSTRESDQDNTNSEKTTITEKTTVSYRTLMIFVAIFGQTYGRGVKKT